MQTTTTAIDRFMRMVDIIPGGCWKWRGYRMGNGYGTFRVNKPRRKVLAHRFSYEYNVATIPDELTLDHLCRNRSCVNPFPLEPVTQKINVRRGIGNAFQLNAAKTQCPRGHAYEATNTYIIPSSGGRACRQCDRERSRKRVR